MTTEMVNIASEIESIENKAAKVLEDAHIKAKEFLAAARLEGDRILCEGVPLNEVKNQCENRLENARIEAREELARAREKGSLVKIAAEPKIEGIVKKIVGIITEGN
jgi:cell division septum initiation protein DivIVA